jgi:hypothetical protein
VLDRRVLPRHCRQRAAIDCRRLAGAATATCRQYGSLRLTWCQ